MNQICQLPYIGVTHSKTNDDGYRSSQCPANENLKGKKLVISWMYMNTHLYLHV